MGDYDVRITGFKWNVGNEKEMLSTSFPGEIFYDEEEV
jgi:hypothetical protein